MPSSMTTPDVVSCPDCQNPCALRVVYQAYPGGPDQTRVICPACLDVMGDELQAQRLAYSKAVRTLERIASRETPYPAVEAQTALEEVGERE